MTRPPSPGLLASLRMGEGCSLHAYPDPKSGATPWTIGYGHTGGVGQHDVCTRAEADAWLEADAQKAIDLVLAHLPWAATLDPTRFDVLAELMFNMGWRSVDKDGHVHGLSTFTRTLAAIEQHDFAAGASGLLASQWAKDVKSRATRLAAKLRNGK